MLTITEAHAVNIVLQAMTGIPTHHEITHDKILDAAGLLADHANKALMAGLDGVEVRAALEDFNTPTLAAVRHERIRQDAKWGEQNHPDGTGGYIRRVEADEARKACSEAADDRAVTWRHILAEEVAEAFAEEDPGCLVEELVQVAAVAVAWIEAFGRRLQHEVER